MKILNTDYSADAAFQIGNMKIQWKQETWIKPNIQFNSSFSEYVNKIIISIHQESHCYFFLFSSPLLSSSEFAIVLRHNGKQYLSVLVWAATSCVVGAPSSELTVGS